MRVVPITLKQASQYVYDHHRHHAPPQGGKFAIAAMEGDELVGVAIIGRPVSRHLDDGLTAEVTRVCTDGARNACSMLYRAAWRACKAMGYTKLVTYTLPEEGGASLRGAGFNCFGAAGGGSWDKVSRPRTQRAPTQVKMRWEVTAQ